MTVAWTRGMRRSGWRRRRSSCPSDWSCGGAAAELRNGKDGIALRLVIYSNSSVHSLFFPVPRRRQEDCSADLGWFRDANVLLEVRGLVIATIRLVG